MSQTLPLISQCYSEKCRVQEANFLWLSFVCKYSGIISGTHARKYTTVSKRIVYQHVQHINMYLL